MNPKKQDMETKNLLTELKHDLRASVVVFFVAVPLCLGIALASGVPLFAGIVSGIAQKSGTEVFFIVVLFS